MVIDYYWYFSQTFFNHEQEKWEYNLDEYGRSHSRAQPFSLLCRRARFPPLADYLHSKGLKFGIHIMRGIPRKARQWRRNLPILGTLRPRKKCGGQSVKHLQIRWSTAMYGVDVSKPAGQAY